MEITGTRYTDGQVTARALLDNGVAVHILSMERIRIGDQNFIRPVPTSSNEA